jgi:hypothetical protein
MQDSHEILPDSIKQPNTQAEGVGEELFLPTLMFGEHHDETITTQILTLLLPKLKSLGYFRFLEEISSNLHLSDVLNRLEMSTQKYKQANQYFKNYGFKTDLCDASCIELQRFSFMVLTGKGEHTVNYLKSIPSDQYDYSFEVIGKDLPDLDSKEIYARFQKIYNEIAFLRRTPVLINYYKNLIALNINFSAVDLAKVDSIPYDKIMKGYMAEERDKCMAQSFLEQRCFGRVGANHLIGLQTEILNTIPRKKAEKTVICFHITRRPLSEGFLEIDHPLGVIQIDARNLTDKEVCNLVIDHIMRVKSLNKDFIKEDAFRVACAIGNIDEVKKFLCDEKIDINKYDNLGRTALHYAVMRKDLIVKLLKTKNLTLAVEKVMENHPEIFKLLLEKGADINIKNTNGNTPLQLLLRDSYSENIDGQQARKMLQIYKESNAQSTNKNSSLENNLGKG